MPDLSTDYLGLHLRSPILVAASTVAANRERVLQAEQAGAGAIVLRSLFQEQIEMTAEEREAFLPSSTAGRRAPLDTVPGGPGYYLEWIESLRERLKIPLIGSLNASSPGGWAEFARRMESAGVDAIELNIYRVPCDPRETSAGLEDEVITAVRQACQAVSVPVAVKLSPFYTAPANLAYRIIEEGAKGLVLFNRFLQPDIDVKAEAIVSEIQFSTPGEIKLPLRWTAILRGIIDADIALTTGVHSGRDVAKALLAGATVVQCASALYMRGIDHLRTLHLELARWMERKGYRALDDFRGRLAAGRGENSADLERAHYVRLLLEQT